MLSRTITGTNFLVLPRDKVRDQYSCRLLHNQRHATFTAENVLVWGGFVDFELVLFLYASECK